MMILQESVNRDGLSAGEMGLAAAQEGRLEEAASLFRQAAGSDPANADWPSLLAVALIRLGDFPAAANALCAALLLAPQRPDSWAQLGLLRAQSGIGGDHAAPLARSILLAPQQAAYRLWFGDGWIRRDNPMTAIAALRMASILDPSLPGLWGVLATAQIAASDRPAALSTASIAVKLAPGHAASWVTLASARQWSGDVGGAAAACRVALVLQPELAQSWDGLAVIAALLGDFSAADGLVRRALTVAPHLARLHITLSELPSFGRRPEDIPAVAALLNDAATAAPLERARLRFALAKTEEAAGDRDAAFRQLLKANALVHERSGYRPDQTLGAMEIWRKIVDADFLKRFAGGGHEDDRPIFIVGMPRSGTSLVEQILASHSQVHGAGESPLLPLLLRDRLDRLSPNLDAALGELDGALLAGWGRGYCAALSAQSPDAARITDKLPTNIQLVGLIHLALPKARIIHIERDPIDTCLSCFSTYFAEGNGFSYDLYELGRYYRAYRQLADHWQAVLPPGRLLSLRYERLVEDFDEEARRLLDYCGLEWEEACSRFYDTPRAVMTASATQVRQPLYRGSIGKKRPAAALLAPLLEGLGPFADAV